MYRCPVTISLVRNVSSLMQWHTCLRYHKNMLVKKLPSHDPLRHAQYKSEIDLSKSMQLVPSLPSAPDFKPMTQWQRDKGASHVFSLKASSRLPQQTFMLSVTADKIQLIHMIIDDFKKNLVFEGKFVAKGPDPKPFKCNQR